MNVFRGDETLSEKDKRALASNAETDDERSSDTYEQSRVETEFEDMRGVPVRANVCQDDGQADNLKTDKDDSDSDTDLSEFYKPTFTMSNKTNVKYELEFHWLYFSNRKNGYMCKYCEVFFLVLFAIQEKSS